MLDDTFNQLLNLVKDGCPFYLQDLKDGFFQYLEAALSSGKLLGDDVYFGHNQKLYMKLAIKINPLANFF